MKSLYDKLLFGLGLLVLFAGIGFYAINFNKTSFTNTKISLPSASQYEPITVPDFDQFAAIWPNASEQASGELYDVFTPPAIWINDEGMFIFDSPISKLPEIPFGVYLAGIDNELYRIQLEGYVEEDFSDPKKSVLLFYDEEKKRRIRARVGDSITGSEFSVYNFTIDRITKLGEIKKLAIATILDLRSGRRIFLTHGENKFKENTTVVIKSKQQESFEAKITAKPPYEFETETAKYILEKINLEESSVTVKRLGNDNLEPETKQLFLESKVTSKSTQVEAKKQFFNLDY